MALEDALVKNERTYIDLSCGTENLSPYSNTSGYSEQSSFYHNDYDWHQQQQRQHHHYHEQQQQQQQQQSHTLQTPQLTDLSSRQYYSSFQETHELPSAIGAFPAFSQHALHQADFYNPVLWPSGQSDHIPASSLTTPPRLFSGIDVSQHVVVSGPQVGHQLQSSSHAKPKRKRVQSFNQRKAANVRERRRMFHLNEAFDVLRKRLPAFNYEKRLSRIETLRLAMTYISFMKDVSVGEDPKGIKLKPHGLDLGDPGMMDSLLGHNSSLSSIDNQDLGSLSNDYSESSNDEMTLQNGVH